MKSRGLVRIVVVGAVIAMAAVSPARAVDSYSADLAVYARDSGSDIAAAQARFKGQTEFDSLVEFARNTEPDNFAWSSWSDAESSSPSLWFVTEPSVAVSERIAALPVVVNVQVGTSLSERDFVSVSNQLAEALSAVSDLQPLLVLPEYRAGFPVIRVIANDSNPTISENLMGAVNEAQAKHPEIDVVFESARVSVVETAVTGGGDIGADGCTAAFTVTSGSYNGITTAAHCDDWTPLYDREAITFGGANTPSQGEVQWSKFTGSVTVSNQIRISTTPTYRAITSTANPSANSLVCYFGKTSSQHCGTVTNSNTSVVLPSGTTGNLFLTDLTTVAPGDSGGPWFYNQTGYGVTTGYLTVVNQSGTHVYSIASRISAIGNLGLTVRTTP